MLNHFELTQQLEQSKKEGGKSEQEVLGILNKNEAFKQAFEEMEQEFSDFLNTLANHLKTGTNLDQFLVVKPGDEMNALGFYDEEQIDAAKLQQEKKYCKEKFLSLLERCIMRLNNSKSLTSEEIETFGNYFKNKVMTPSAETQDAQFYRSIFSELRTQLKTCYPEAIATETFLKSE